MEIGKEALPYLIDILERGIRLGQHCCDPCEDIVKRLLDENKNVDPETEK